MIIDNIINSLKKKYYNKDKVKWTFSNDEFSDWDVYTCNCGESFVFDEHPKESGYKYCPACGGEIIEFIN